MSNGAVGGVTISGGLAAGTTGASGVSALALTGSSSLLPLVIVALVFLLIGASFVLRARTLINTSPRS